MGVFLPSSTGRTSAAGAAVTTTAAGVAAATFARGAATLTNGIEDDEAVTAAAAEIGALGKSSMTDRLFLLKAGGVGLDGGVEPRLSLIHI